MNIRMLKVQTGEIPITLEQARAHLRLDVYGSPPANDEDGYVTALLAAVCEDAENYTGLLFTEYNVELAMDRFPVGNLLDLGVWPVNAVTSVSYKDGGVTREIDLADLAVDNFSKPAKLHYSEQQWPSTDGTHNNVVVTFRAGFAPAGSPPSPVAIPAVATKAMLLLLGHLFRNREAVNVGNLVTSYPLGYLHLLQPLRIGQGM